jgi:hypothetical protein
MRSVLERLELAPLGDPGLVDVTADHELGARCRKPLQDVVAARKRPLSGAPGRRGQVMVEGDDAKGALLGSS